MLVSIGEAGSGAYSVASPYFGDFDLRVAAQAVEGPIDNGYGVVFRCKIKTTPRLTTTATTCS